MIIFLIKSSTRIFIINPTDMETKTSNPDYILTVVKGWLYPNWSEQLQMKHSFKSFRKAPLLRWLMLLK